MNILQECQRLFGTTNLYEVMHLQRSSNISVADVKVAYYRAAMVFQPDKVRVEGDNSEATEKFQLLSKVYTILVDSGKRQVYDTTGQIPKDLVFETNFDWYGFWAKLFRCESIVAFYKQYVGSPQEKEDLKRHYIDGRGDMNYIMLKLRCARLDEEERVVALLKEMIAAGELEDNPNFSREPMEKKRARHAWGVKEAEAAIESMCETIRRNGDSTVAEAVEARGAERWASVMNRAAGSTTVTQTFAAGAIDMARRVVELDLEPQDTSDVESFSELMDMPEFAGWIVADESVETQESGDIGSSADPGDRRPPDNGREGKDDKIGPSL